MIGHILRKIAGAAGYDLVRRIRLPAGSDRKPPYSSFKSVIEDVLSRGFVCRTVLDIGANNASWSGMAAPLLSGSRFFLIEPQAEMESFLADFCKVHPGSKYFLNGAGASSERRTFTVWDDKAGSSFIPAAGEVFDYANEKREIEIITIDSLIEKGEIDTPDLVKMDVQGFELEVLKGSGSLFGKTELFILETSFFRFEGMPLFFEIVEFMEKNGYVVYDFAGFSRRPHDGALGQCDVVFARKDGILRTFHQWR